MKFVVKLQNVIIPEPNVSIGSLELEYEVSENEMQLMLEKFPVYLAQVLDLVNVKL